MRNWSILQIFVLVLLSNSTLIAGVLRTPAKSKEYIEACNMHGQGFNQISGFDSCIRIGGDVRIRYNNQYTAAAGDKNESMRQRKARDDEAARIHPYPINSTDEQMKAVDAQRAAIENSLLPTVQDYTEADSKVDYGSHGSVFVDVRVSTEKGMVRTFAKFAGNAGSEMEVEIDEAFIQIGNFVAGRTRSFSNLTFGSYANNANFSTFDIDRKIWMLGHTLEAGHGIKISGAIEESVRSNFEVDSVNAEYDTDLDSTYAMVIPDLVISIDLSQNWGAFGLTAGFHDLSAEATKILDNPDTEVDETTAAKGDSIEIGKNAFFVGAGGEINITSSTEIGASGFFSNGNLYRIGIGEFGVNDAYLHTPIEDEKAREVDEILSATGFSVNVGLSHELNSQFLLHTNSGFFSISDGKEYESLSVTGIMAGGSIDYFPTSNLKFTLGGEFQRIQEDTPADAKSSGNALNNKDYVDKELTRSTFGITAQVIHSF